MKTDEQTTPTNDIDRILETKINDSSEIPDLTQRINLLSSSNLFLLLHHPEFFQQNGLLDLIPSYIQNLPDDDKIDLLNHHDLIQKFQIDHNDLRDIIQTVSDDVAKLKIANSYNFDSTDVMIMLASMTDETKIKLLLSNPYNWDSSQLQGIFIIIKPNNVLRFYLQNKEELKAKNITLKKIIRDQRIEKQQMILDMMNSFNLDEQDKIEIYSAIHYDLKMGLDTKNLSPKYLLAMQTDRDFMDLSGDLERYREFDRVIEIDPTHFNADELDKFNELCKICPNLSIVDQIEYGFSTVEQYRQGEAWINNVISQIKPDWTDVQKVIWIDYNIGKRISYSPDFETEVSIPENARPIWRVAATGYGVCNGISHLERYMLSKVGIHSETVSGRMHSFLLIKDIALPTTNGIQKGDTLLDPTWNLSDHRFDAMPKYLCVNYESIRKGDWKYQEDSESHKNDKYQYVTNELNEEILRNEMKKIGIITREDGKFSVYDMIESIDDEISKQEASQHINVLKIINVLFREIEKKHPDFIHCQNSTISFLSKTVRETIFKLQDKNLIKKPTHLYSFISRAYEKDDVSKTPLSFVFIGSFHPKNGIIYVADPHTKKFAQYSTHDFKQKFDCYKLDLNKPGFEEYWNHLIPNSTSFSFTQDQQKESEI